MEEMNKESKKKLEETMDNAEAEYKKALDEIPSSWGLVGMQVRLFNIYSSYREMVPAFKFTMESHLGNIIFLEGPLWERICSLWIG